MLSFFPDRTIESIDARKQSITVRHLAGMSSGMVSRCLGGDLDTLEEMRRSPDWLQWALDRRCSVIRESILL